MPGIDALERYPSLDFFPRQAASVARQFLKTDVAFSGYVVNDEAVKQAAEILSGEHEAKEKRIIAITDGVNAVPPGIAIFPEDYDEATRKKLLARTLLRREGGGREIARAVRYLLEGTETMTGQVLTLNGGRTVAL